MKTFIKIITTTLYIIGTCIYSHKTLKKMYECTPHMRNRATIETIIDGCFHLKLIEISQM